MKRPFVFIGATMFISLLIYSYHGITAAVVMFIIAAIFSLPAFIFRNKNKKFLPVLCVCFSLMLSSFLFSAKTVYEYLPAIQQCGNSTHKIQGTVTEYESAYGNYYYTLDNTYIDDVPTKHKIRVTFSASENVDIDDTIIVSNAYIYELGSDYDASLNHKADGVYIGAYTNINFAIHKSVEHSALYYIQNARNYITDKLNENMYPEYAAVTNALLTGNNSAIDHNTNMDFRYSGISHLFAVSGFHLALWSFLLSYVLSTALKKHKTTAHIISIIFVIFFMSLTGFSKSVVRAGIMIILMLFGKIIKSRADSLNSLFFALTLILVINPFAATSLSLQMSFLATFGIITLSSPISEPLKSLKKKIPQKILYNTLATVYTTVMISIVATLFTIPVSAINFGYYSPIAPVSNLLCMPVSQMLMPLAGFAVILSPVRFIAKPIFVLCNFLVKYLLSVTSAIGHIPYFVTKTDTAAMQTILFTILLITAIFLIIFTGKNKNLRRCISVSAIAILLFSVSTELIRLNSYEITVADVGNGTSVILSTGKSFAVIGCGGNKDSDFYFRNHTDKNTKREYDLLLIPRNTNTESQYASSIVNLYKYNSCIIADECFSPELTEKLPENTRKASETTVTLDENTTLIYINNSGFSGVRIDSPNFRATILFKATSDFSAVDQEWQNGNLLVTRQKLPQINTEGFETVLVSTSFAKDYASENVFSTENFGSIRYTKFPWGGSSINAIQ